MKSLVVYYSRTGNSRFVAETIAAIIGADVEEIVDLKKRKGVLGFLSGGKDAKMGKETKIVEPKRSLDGYDLVVVGQPVWASSPTPAIRTYLKGVDLSGRKVALFFTQDGKKAQAVDKTLDLIRDCEYLGVLSLVNPLKDKVATEQRIADWCSSLL